MTRPAGPILSFLVRYQGLLTAVGLVAAVLPFAALSFYNHPTLDDMLDAVTVREQGFWQSQRFYYLTLTGRYTTTILLALANPLVYTRLEEHWWVSLVFMAGTLLLLHWTLRLLGGLTPAATWRGAGLLLAMWLAYAPGHTEGLYWFTGAYTYITSAWLLLAWAAALGHYLRARRAGRRAGPWLAGLAVLTIAVAGTTEPVALPFLLALLLGAVLNPGQRRGRVAGLVAGLALAGCFVSFAAPGNLVRLGFMDQQFGVLKSVGYSTAATAYLLLTWVANPVLWVLTVLLLPALYRVARHGEQALMTHLASRPVGVVAGMLGGLMIAASCPAYYASGTGLPLRARNMLYLLFVVGWFGIGLIWCCRQARRSQPGPVLGTLLLPYLTPVWAGLLVLFFFADYNVQTRATMLGQGSNNVVRAYQQWLGGEAGAYDAEMRARYRALDDSRPTVALQPLRHRPDLLYSFDAAEIADTTLLRQYARYFGKKPVIIRAATP